MIALRFTWSPAKANRNLRRNKVSFEVASNVFIDPYAIFVEDCETDDGEMRYHAIGYAGQQLLTVGFYVDPFKDQDEVLRIVSARKAESFEERIYADQFI